MSQYAKKALLEAAADNSEAREQLQKEDTFDAAAAEVLELTPNEKDEVMASLQNGDTSEPVMEEAEERETPGPGVIGK